MILYISIYLFFGIICAIIFELLMNVVNSKKAKNIERFFWVLFWPMFVFIFNKKMKD